MGEIVSIYILSEYMGKGDGKKLLKAVLDKLADMGFEDVFLWVLEENLRARNFYEYCGWQCTDEYIEDNIGGKK